MHAAAMTFCRRTLEHIPAPGFVLEIGAYNVNGSARELLPREARVHGIDIRPGPGVDAVIDAVQYDGEEAFDLVLCTETLEHAPDPAGIIACAWRSLKPGGVLIVTAASPERAPHSCDGDPFVPVGEHYGNIDPVELARWLAGWAFTTIEQNHAAGDVYARAVKPRPPRTTRA